MKVSLINLPLLGSKNDLYGNIPSFPIGLCYVASYIRAKGHDVSLIDLYGLAPCKKVEFKHKFEIWGLELEEGLGLIPSDVEVIGISVHSVSGYSLAKELVQKIKREYDVPVVLGGACATVLADDFIRSGADYVILGEGEKSFNDFLLCVEEGKDIKNIDGIVSKSINNKKSEFIEDLDSLPFPAFDLLPLENYWNLGYAHGPVSGKYLTIVSSRGCPFHCAFCASPYIWQRKWRSRSPENVIEEIAFFKNKFDIKDFHFQDDAFSINRKRVMRISGLIKERNLDIKWSLPAGIKAETIDKEVLAAMKESGFRYISLSPESGSKNVLEAMKKPFDHNHMIRITRWANALGIKTQACFVLGFPGETKTDLLKTVWYILKLAVSGVDEIACYIMTPLPGAEVFSDNYSFSDYEDLNFSPKWRDDFTLLNRLRLVIYLLFFFFKLLFHPLKMFVSIHNIFTRKFETKFEMTVYRALKTRFLKPRREGTCNEK